MSDITDHEALKVKLNAETAQINWIELQRFFAKGLVLKVEPSEDLVEVAATIIEDNKEKARALIAAEKIKHVSDQEAMTWHEQDHVLWAVTAPPWVLVQDK